MKSCLIDFVILIFSRPSRNEEREMNTETFGVSSVRGYGYRGYRRGRGRGGRGRGGGGYYRGGGGGRYVSILQWNLSLLWTLLGQLN